ncbi:ABD1 [Candida oxycetoniae]|uniref:mRNA cap guanine-N(7) methyltransferase n=1 Tax=Candida oxycetoniae TaxID=497107 RepID=A0AAI9WWB5_9ASCO|nr:ABD1 [Candida oxycetoniae]KAI3402857.2 ABD1 [Candida oxycetoniae]
MSDNTYIPVSKNSDENSGLKKRRVGDSHHFDAAREKNFDAQPSSIYSNVKEKTPAWLKKNDSKNLKYEKYAPRSNHGNSSWISNEPAVSTTSSLYQKYSAVDDSRMDRMKRNRQRLEQSLSSTRNNKDEEQEKKETEGKVEEKDEEMITNGHKGDEQEMGINPYLHLDIANPSVNHLQKESNYQTFQSKIFNKESRDINSIVRQHYNQRTQQSRKQGKRTDSPIYKLRNFNNTIKYILLGNWVKYISEGSPSMFSILDLCCGKGGDLNKCEFIEIDQYIGIDISDLSVREAFQRYSRQKAMFKTHSGQRSSGKYNFEACFATGDCFTESVPEILEPNFPGIIEKTFPVDAVSTQFALHYAFETEEKVRTLLTNVAKSLKVGGVFVGTIPSSDFIKSKIIAGDYRRDADNKVKFGNSLYSVTFDKEPLVDGLFRPPFGNRYTYWLKDAVDNVPEYVVPFETLRALCEEYNLTLKYKKNFIDIFNQEIPKYFGKLNKNLVEGLKRSDGKYGAEGEEKEAVGFYIGFVFKKVL